MAQVSPRTRFGIFASLSILLGCKGSQQGAREYFSRTHSCPVEQVQAKARSDVKHSDFSSWPTPPADVAADPNRRAVWEKNLQEQKDGLDRQSSVFEVSGCGRSVYLACKRRSGNAAQVVCSEGPISGNK
jgi:hypothetical protein